MARIITSPVAADGLFQAGRTVRFAGRDITLTAVYADPSPSFAVTFRENGGADGTVTWEGPPEASITYPGAFDLLFRGPGTTFLGWSTSADATVADPAFDRLSISALTGDLVLYAVWEDAPRRRRRRRPRAAPERSPVAVIFPAPEGTHGARCSSEPSCSPRGSWR